MSRTYRNNPIRTRSVFGRFYMDWEKGQWRREGPEPRGDSKPWNERNVARYHKQLVWRCRCEDYCIAGKLHKHHRRGGFPIHWELKQLE